MTASTVASGLPTRAEVPEKLQWDLTPVFGCTREWETAFKTVEESIPELESYKGKLSQSADTLLKALRARDRVMETLGKVRTYASMRHHEDTSLSANQGMYDRTTTLWNRVSAALAYMTPEILAMSKQQVQEFQKQQQELKLYSFALDELFRRKPHVRSAEVEALLAQSNELKSTPGTVYGQLTNADMKYAPVEDAKGKKIALTDGNYVSRFLQSKDRGERQRAFETMMGAYKDYRNTFGSLYSNQVKGNIFSSRARSYSSSIEAALDSINIPVSVYNSLADTVSANLPLLNRYLELRKRALGLSELHMYDLYTPIVEQADYMVSYDEAQRIVLEALRPLGTEYVDALKQGFNSRWVDVVENRGKRSGAYSGGAFGTPPYILMNWSDGLKSMMTLAHEAGHSMHSFFTRKTQPYVYGGYTIFVAEVASTCNEALLRHHLLQTVQDKGVRALLINDALEGFRSTLYRQCLFAEFERDAHARAEAGEALTTDVLCSIFKGLNDKYYGAVCHVDELIENEWMRIPHFYSSFYVYQYCTGISAGVALAEQMLKEGAPAVKRYLKFLSSGSSDYSINLLKDAGVDLSTPTPVQQAADSFASYLTEFESCLNA